MGSIYESTYIAAPIDEVWARIRDYRDMSWAAGVVVSNENIGDPPGNQVGARRLINGVLQETLAGLDEDQHLIRYTIEQGPPPMDEGVTNYAGQLQLRPVTADGGTFVEWSSSWDGKDMEIYEFLQPLIATLLGSLKTSVSGAAAR